MKKRRITIVTFVALLFLLFANLYYEDNFSYINNSEYYIAQNTIETHDIDQGILYPGRYNIEIKYSTDTDADFEIINNDDMSVLYKGKYDSKTNVNSIEVNVEKFIKRISLRSYSNSDITINSFICQSIGNVYNDRFFIIAFLILLVLFLYYLNSKEDKNYLFAILLISIFVSLPLFTDFLETGHDIAFHLNRIANIGLEIRNGDFPVRINTTFENSGSITPIMYPELLLYFPGLMCFLKASAMFSLKSLVFFANIICGFIAYISAKRITNKKIALLFAVLYVLNPYRLNNFYCRAAIGEFLAMSFMPLAFCSLYDLIQGDYKRGLFEAPIGVTLVFQSHIISMFLFVVFGVIYLLAYIILNTKCFINDKKRIMHILLAALLTLSLNFWFIIPFIKYASGNFYVYNASNGLYKEGIYIYQMFMDIFNENAIKFDNTYQEMPLTIGIYCLIGMIIVIYMLKKNRIIEYRNICLGSLIFGLLYLLLASSIFPWLAIKELLPFIYSIFKPIQFSIRFLSIGSMLTCFSISIALSQTTDCKFLYNGTLIVFFLAFFSALTIFNGYINETPIFMENKSSSFFSNNRDYCYKNDDYQETREFILEKNIYGDKDIYVKEFVINGSKYIIKFNNSNSSKLILPIYYYDNLYTAKTSKNEQLIISKSDLNTLEINIPKNIDSDLIVIQKNGSLFIIGDVVTVVTIICIFLMYSCHRRKNII